MSPSILPPFSSSLKRPLPSCGFEDSDDTLRRKLKLSRLQHEAFPRRIISLSSASLPQVSSASSHGPKSLLQNKTETSVKTSPAALNLERGRTICLTAATTSLKGSRSVRDFEGPKSLAEILKEKRQCNVTVDLHRDAQESELEEGEFIPSNDKDDPCQHSSSHSTTVPSSASVNMAPAEEAESQLAAASEDIDDGEIDDDDADFDSDIDGEIDDDDADFDSDIDIDEAQLELFFNEQDYINCKEYVTSLSHLLDEMRICFFLKDRRIV